MRALPSLEIFDGDVNTFVIVLEPSASIKRCFSKIDFDVLSIAVTSVFTTIFGKQHNQCFRIFKSRDKNADCYYFFDGDIYLQANPKRTVNNVIRTIIHELRHWQQEKIFRKNIYNKELYSEDTKSKYWNSPLEVDARNFDKIISTQVKEIYTKLMRVKKMNKENELDRFHTPSTVT